jgi:hypothetical protein
MTELIWEGKYDADGRRVAPLRVALPFQRVETVNESAQQRQGALDLFSQSLVGWRRSAEVIPGGWSGLANRRLRGSAGGGRAPIARESIDWIAGVVRSAA